MEYNRFEEEIRIRTNETIPGKEVNFTEEPFYTAEGAVVKGYKTIENGVVGGYKKIENAFVSGWEKVEDACVDVLFKKEGETTAHAKERLGGKSGAQPEEAQA